VCAVNPNDKIEFVPVIPIFVVVAEKEELVNTRLFGRVDPYTPELTAAFGVIKISVPSEDMEDIKVPDPQMPKNWKVFPAIIPDSPEK
jgi:hypothetical protein